MNTTLVIAAFAVFIVIALLITAIVLMQSSIRNLGETISGNQRDASAMQREQIERQNESINAMNVRLNESMNQVNRSLGEMKNLSTGIDDLKKIMSNVKSRGIVGEIQLGAILGDILAPEQYEINVSVTGTSERVEYAVKFPTEDGCFMYLPIDSKFPGDAYINLLDAYEKGNSAELKKVSGTLRTAIMKAAKDIRTKYICPPKTTDFGIMFLPFEGLYAEVLRLNVIEELQRTYHVTVAGPSTMAALLNSFQMGFRTIALQQSSDRVWDTLEKAKTEFDRFGKVLGNVQNKLDQSQKELETLVGTRTRAIQRTLDKLENR